MGGEGEHEQKTIVPLGNVGGSGDGNTQKHFCSQNPESVYSSSGDGNATASLNTKLSLVPVC